MSQNRSRGKQSRRSNIEEDKDDGASGVGKKDQWTMMRTILSRMYSTIEKDQGKVTFSTFLAAVYSFYLSKEAEFYTFIKYIEEYCKNNSIKLDSVMTKDDLIHL